MSNSSGTRWLLIIGLVLAGCPGDGSAQEPVDYLSFAHGTIPVTIAGDGVALKTGFNHALSSIDENMSPFVLTPKPGGPDTKVEIIYELPALTTFSLFTVPNVSETPSPSQTFFKYVGVHGAVDGPDGPWVQLGNAVLETHSERGQRTDFPADQEHAVRWVKLVLNGGINVLTEKSFFEFSEIIGTGSQEPVAMSEGFTGKWKGRGVLMELRQDGALVNGCYDRTGDLNGAVNGKMLYASGQDRNDKTLSTFVLMVTPDGGINGVRSSNGGPFRIYTGTVAPEGTETGCSQPQGSTLGCGSIVYGIQFDFDSATIKPESKQVLQELYEGLKQSSGVSILIEGHTSSEGSESYNQELSERRASSVVDALISLGLDQAGITAAGKGENDPVASNDDEAGRLLNRRVEVECAATDAD